MKPGILYYQLGAGERSVRVTLLLTETEAEHLEEIASAGGREAGKSEILRWGLYKVLQDHGYPVWSNDDD